VPNLKLAHILNYWRKVRSSYWFIPSAMALSALALSLVTSRLDVYLGADWLTGTDFLLSNHPDGRLGIGRLDKATFGYFNGWRFTNC
jgi:hypothetical protein